MTNRTCTVRGCGRPHYGRDLCSLHYQRWRRRRGGSEIAGRGEPEAYLLAVLTTMPTGCTTWPFAAVKGYGRIKALGDVHVLVCTWYHGQRPSPRHEVCHACGHGHLGCFTPAHLYWGTRQDQWRDRRQHQERNEPKC